MVTSPWRERREVWREKTKSANFWQGKVWAHCQLCEFLARDSVNSSPILARHWWRHFRLSLYLSLSLSLSPKVPHAQYRKRFRASYNNYGCIMYTLRLDECFTVTLSFSHKRSSDGKLTLNIGLICTICTCFVQVPTITVATWLQLPKEVIVGQTRLAPQSENASQLAGFTHCSISLSGLIAWPLEVRRDLTVYTPSLSWMECAPPTLCRLLRIRSRMWLPSCSGWSGLPQPHQKAHWNGPRVSPP